ncbi:unnamed protein product [Cylindrotheca closterium]|uniref:YrhK domain-containing protein n=1 Tax=Cylindrotheca closterium TaxID=2856 RepID=A0AAD2FSH8_9STRA|nr:unnamed protein product [Cylindrotheca closterium]
MPHLLVNRPRIFGRKVRILLPPEEALSQFKWEIISSFCHQVGSVILLIGSIFSIPSIRDATVGELGTFFFVAASSCYMIVSAHDCYEIICYHSRQDDWDKILPPGEILDIASAGTYFCGSLCFIIGSFCFIFHHTISGGVFKVIGSFLFMAGAVVNSAQSFDAPTYRAKLFSNLTAVSYSVGSMAYLAGSIPHLWSLKSMPDQDRIDTYLAGLFIVGSSLFVIGGSLNFHRAKCIFQHEYPNATLGPVVTSSESGLDEMSSSEEAPLLTI